MLFEAHCQTRSVILVMAEVEIKTIPRILAPIQRWQRPRGGLLLHVRRYTIMPSPPSLTNLGFRSLPFYPSLKAIL
jgi:hypothetical protein